MSGYLQNFDLTHGVNILRLICGLFFIPHIYAKFFVPEALGFFVAAKFRPPAAWVYTACVIETFLAIGLIFAILPVLAGALGCVQADARLDRVRAFVKVQDGCSFSCNFCVVPLVRGRSRSRRAAAVLGEIRRRVAQGHREVVLTGINLGCYRDRAAGYDLPRLVRAAGATPGLERLRLSSIEIAFSRQRRARSCCFEDS